MRKSNLLSKRQKNTTDEQADMQQIWFSGTVYYGVCVCVCFVGQLSGYKLGINTTLSRKLLNF